MFFFFFCFSSRKFLRFNESWQGSAHTGPALTPAEVLVAIHDITLEKDGLALKKACIQTLGSFTHIDAIWYVLKRIWCKTQSILRRMQLCCLVSFSFPVEIMHRYILLNYSHIIHHMRNYVLPEKWGTTPFIS